MKKLIVIIASFLVILIAWFVLPISPSEYEDRNPDYIIHRYPVAANKELIVNNWNCGATCAFHITVYLKDTTSDTRKNTVIIDCDHVNNIQLTDITERSAKIKSLEITDENLSCKYRQGDIIWF